MITGNSDPGPGRSARPPPQLSLNGVRILVVEDEFLLALQLEELLHSLGCIVFGPFGWLDQAVAASGRESFDVAILDINLHGTPVYPLADALTARGVPFVFLSGYTATNLPERFRSTTRLSKPCDPELLVRTVRGLL